MLTVVVPVRVISEANARGHWRARHRRTRDTRHVVTMCLDAAWGVTPPSPPLVVRLTRIAPRSLDVGDNLPMSLKAAKDAVAKWLGVDDRRDDLVRYEYSQEKGQPREYAVRIEVMR